MILLFSEYLEEGAKISMDYDDTLQFNGEDEEGDSFPIYREEFIKKFAEHLNNGDTVCIISSRYNTHNDDVPVLLSKKFSFLEGKSLKEIAELNGKTIEFKPMGSDEKKVQEIVKEKIYMHYDDNGKVLNELKGHGILTTSACDENLAKLYQKYYGFDEIDC